jgi:hypothetical protein
MQRVQGPHIFDPSMLMGVTERIAGLCRRGGVALLPASEVGVGYSSFALNVGDSGVGKPGYLRLTSVKRVRSGRLGLS